MAAKNKKYDRRHHRHSPPLLTYAITALVVIGVITHSEQMTGETAAALLGSIVGYLIGKGSH